MDEFKCIEAILIIGSALIACTVLHCAIAVLDGGEDDAFTIMLRHIWEVRRWHRHVTVENGAIQHEDDLHRKAQDDDMMYQHLQIEESAHERRLQ